MKVTQKTIRPIVATAFVAAHAVALLPGRLLAQSPVQQAQEGANSAGADGGPSFEDVVLTVSNILIFIVGIAAVIGVIIGALRYTTANGDQSAIGTAKNTILYSIVGLILAIAAFGIVNFVLQQFN